MNYEKCEIMIVNDVEKCDFEIDLAELEVIDEISIKRFNRAKIKQETRKKVKEYFDEIGE